MWTASGESKSELALRREYNRDASGERPITPVRVGYSPAMAVKRYQMAVAEEHAVFVQPLVSTVMMARRTVPTMLTSQGRHVAAFFMNAERTAHWCEAE